MINQYIEYPYIVFPFGSAKPALVITIAYICILTVLIEKEKGGDYKWHQSL